MLYLSYKNTEEKYYKKGFWSKLFISALLQYLKNKKLFFKILDL